jgi:small conductance mechanosensitive channel
MSLRRNDSSTAFLSHWLTCHAVSGTVKELGLFACELQTWDGIYLFVPNSELWNKRIINFSRYATRLVDLKYGVSYDDDLAKGQEVLLTIAREDARAQVEPEPIVFVDELGDSAVVLRLRCWVATPEYWPLRRALTRAASSRWRRRGLRSRSRSATCTSRTGRRRDRRARQRCVPPDRFRASIRSAHADEKSV